jgi:hypothetical protein
MRRVLGGALAAGLAVAAGIALSAPAIAPAQGGQLQVGVGVEDASWHVGASAGQYAGAPEDPQPSPENPDGNTLEFVDHETQTFDPTGLSTRRFPSYGLQSRLSVRAIVIEGPGGDRVAILKNDLYIPQDLVYRRAAQILEAGSSGIGRENLTMAVTHNHSSPFYSSTSWGAWAFQDVFDIRFFEYMAQQMAAAVEEAAAGLTPARVAVRSTYYDKTHRHSFGQARADDGTPAGYPNDDQDHDMTVIRFDDVSGGTPEPLANLVNFSQHPEFLEGNDLISADYVGPFERMMDRETGAVTVYTQGSVGTSEPERSSFHSIHERLEFTHKDYAQAEWGARLMANAARGAWEAIGNDDPAGQDKYIPFSAFGSAPEVEMADRWYPGPFSHPYPGVSNCRVDASPGIPIVGLPDCTELPFGVQDALDQIPVPEPVTDQLGPLDPGVTIDQLPGVPANYSAPSYTGLAEDIDVHLQAVRIGPLFLPMCSCEQWWDQSRNIELRTDKVVGNEDGPLDALGYDWGARCTPNNNGTYPPNDDGTIAGTGTWNCPNSTPPVTNHEYQRMRAQVTNPANGWNDVANAGTAEDEPPAPDDIKGNYTHDDRCGLTPLTAGDSDAGCTEATSASASLGYDLTVPIGMANDYNGYIASYREYQRGDHYRKALTGWGPHSSDYMASRLVTLGREFNNPLYVRPQDQVEEDLLQPKVTADLAVNDQRAQALGTVGTAALAAYEAGLPADGGSEEIVSQPEDIERFDAALITWNGGSNYTDNPVVKVQREVSPGNWEDYADQSGELPVTLEFPTVQGGAAPYTQGDQQWHWTARFEAFVAGAEDQPINTGDRAAPTPPGAYRFVIEGQRREGDPAGVTDYTLTSEEFEVSPWDGILAQDFKLESDGTMSFRIGPTSTFPNPVAGCAEDTIGPIDYPDTHTADDPARFIRNQRTPVGDGTCDVEWFCFTCTWRPWLDFGDAETAKVTVTLGNGTTEVVDANRDGERWRTTRVLNQNEQAQVKTGNVVDPYGNTNQDSIILANGPGPADADGDGTPDASDNCPNVPGPSGNQGCPQPTPTDGDGDGVPDNADNCPNAPGPINNFGCPPAGARQQQAAAVADCGTLRAGTRGPDILAGTPFGDLLRGLSGRDRINGGEGADCVFGGRGKDRLDGENGDDLVRGGDGRDRIAGGAGNDTVSGGRGRDRIAGGDGDDSLRSVDGDPDRLDCGPGRDNARIGEGDRTRGCERVKRVTRR